MRRCRVQLFVMNIPVLAVTQSSKWIYPSGPIFFVTSLDVGHRILPIPDREQVLETIFGLVYFGNFRRQDVLMMTPEEVKFNIGRVQEVKDKEARAYGTR